MARLGCLKWLETLWEHPAVRIQCENLPAQNLPSQMLESFAADGKLKISGRGSAWLERLVRDQEVGGSNPLAPTISFNHS